MRVYATLVATCTAAAMIMAAAVHATVDPGHCKPEMTSCEFWLDIVAVLTGITMKEKEPKMTVPYNGKMYEYPYTPTYNYYGVLRPVELSNVTAADGYPESRMLYLVNGSLPGPTLTVYNGQNITVHIRNHLTDAATSIHFHGITQQGTPYADGVSFVTQCPISPGQTFAHNFNITQTDGTYWYHAHAGNQRTMGMYGAFIIKKKDKPEPEHVLLLQDYNHDWSSEMHFLKSTYGLYKGKEKRETTKSQDGGFFSGFSFHSGLINGLGRWHNDPERPNKHNKAPLSKFEVEQGKSYRFRVIAAGTQYPFRFSVDEHELTVVATDGLDVDDVAVESFIINPGERYDVILIANQAVKNYMIRAQTLEVGVNHIAEAILNYETIDPFVEPKTSRRACTVAKPCKVLNCPFKYYSKESNTECINVDKLTRGKEGEYAPKAEGSSYKQFFLNFAFPGRYLDPDWHMTYRFPGQHPEWSPGSVNGRAFNHPPVNPLAQMIEMDWECDSEQCGDEKVCPCTYHVDIDFGDTVQMVLLNMGLGKGWAHPIHLHGHSFYVVKVEFGQYNSTTGDYTDDNSDIKCLGESSTKGKFCNNATWSDDTWVDDIDNIPGLNLKNPPLKDTVMVPPGGYVIIRFKADNPGVWIMHCHIELHNVGGMAMLIREGRDKIPEPPNGYPTCRNFDYLGGKAPQGFSCRWLGVNGGMKAGVFFGASVLEAAVMAVYVYVYVYFYV